MALDLFMNFILEKPSLIRWYWLHACGNIIVCIYTWSPMIQLLTNPIGELSNPVRFDESTCITSVIHLYHLLFFKCNAGDWFHHLSFALVGTIVQSTVNVGKLPALYHFFACGAPGCIDYILLALVKEKQITKQFRLKCAVELNIWFRAPGIIMAWCFLWIWYITSGQGWYYTICFIIWTTTSLMNAQYYSRLITLAGGKQLVEYDKLQNLLNTENQ